MKKIEFNMDSPEVRAQRDDIQHGAFVRQGTMVAFPLCFPGASIPIVADESFITALDIVNNEIVYGGTSGQKVHIFGATFRGAKGAVFDMGIVDGADHCAAICCGQDKLIACVNGPDGGRLIRSELRFMAAGRVSDLLQEWEFIRPDLEDIGPAIAGEKIIHAVVDSQRENVIVLTQDHLVMVGIENGNINIIDEVPGMGQLAIGSMANVFGFDTDDSLWLYDTSKNSLTRHAVKLPDAQWQGTSLRWASGTADGVFYTTDNDGWLFSFAEGKGFSKPLGKVSLSPVGPMAATFDGRVFGMCGQDMANLFCYDPGTDKVTNLGVPISVIERRRYGYVFGDAVTGKDGQIYFGENDNLGHLWIYFPSIKKSK